MLRQRSRTPVWLALSWRILLQWLRDDRLISADDVERTTKRFGASDSKQHPLVRLGAAGLAVMEALQIAKESQQIEAMIPVGP